MNLLNDDQRRRIGTHLRLLVSDLDTLAQSPELERDAAGFATVRDAIAVARRSADGLRTALALPLDKSPSIARRVAAVAEVWAARIEDLRARRLAGYGAVHPDLAGRLDPGVELVRQSLEALAAAAARLPEDAT
ncbi:MAG TPA: hypothetical protein VIV88_16175 [Gemmatimonadales bacterium]